MTAIVLALLAGAVVGLSLGALGSGGSVLAVPALIYLMGFSPDHATTASLLVVVATSTTALTAHARTGAVRWRLGTSLAVAGVIPAATAGVLTHHIPAAALTAAFAAIAALAATAVLREPRPTTPRTTHALPTAGLGVGLGTITGLLGVGGGFLTVPALIRVLSVPISAAIGTSLFVITVNAAAALTPRLGSLALLDWTLIGPFAAAALLGAWDGKRLAAKVRPTTLHRIFAAALLAVSAFMAVDAARQALG